MPCGAQTRARTAERYLPAPEEAGRICDAGPAGSCGSRGVLRCRTGRRRKGRPHIEKPYVSETHDGFHFWNAIPWSPTFFPAAGKECRPRKGAPPRVSGLNFETPAYVRATRSLRSLKHGAAASRRRSQNFPLRGRPPTERAGKLHQCWTCIVHRGRASFSTRTFLLHRCGPT